MMVYWYDGLNVSYTMKKLAMEPMLYALFMIPRRLSSGLSKYAVHRFICCEEFIIILIN